VKVEFRLTYSGPLLAPRDGQKLAERSLHVHAIRKRFHRQRSRLWDSHPVLSADRYPELGEEGALPFQDFRCEDFFFRPIVTAANGMICSLDVLMLRVGVPGGALHDVDNRLKTIFDALRMPKDANELGARTSAGIQTPAADERPFLVLLEDDRLITHVAVSTDMLLEPVSDPPSRDEVRLLIHVTVRPYDVNMENLAFA
jgi:hypothetical protein